MKPQKFHPDRRMHQETTLADVLQNIIKGYRLDKKIDEIDIVNAWKNVLGSGVANYTTEVFFKKDTVFVRLSSAVLREELSYGKQKIIKMLNEEIGKEVVKNISYI